MFQTDREEFNRQISVLCAGFNVPATAERIEAYWRGLEKMPMSSFVRVVNSALGDEYDEKKIPTVGNIWDLHRKFRSSTRGPQESAAPKDTGMTRQQHLIHLRRMAITSARRETMPMTKGKIMGWESAPDWAKADLKVKWKVWEEKYADLPDDYWWPRARELMLLWGEKNPDEAQYAFGNAA